jgi:cysteine desulfurase / selenocysteine lyase
VIYLDNAATSFPKPRECLERGMEEYLRCGFSPGRGGYDAVVEAEERVSGIRRRLCRFFGADDSYHCCFTYNATEALNLLIQGLNRPGGRVVSSWLEHNAVLRPLHHLQQEGLITVDLVPFNDRGYLNPEQVAAAIGADTGLVVLTHASNVLGTIQPLATLGRICRERQVPLVIDASQTAGIVPVAMKEWGLGGIAFTGHKSLLGPTGIGGLVLAPDLHPRPVRFGGTGVDSASLFQTPEYPYRLEAGTVNLLGILCLDYCLDYLERRPWPVLYEGEMALWEKLREGLAAIPGVSLYGARNRQDHLPLLTCALEGHQADDVGTILDGDYGIAVRSGLQCAPLVHRQLGTLDRGGIRFSLGPFTTEADITAALEAMEQIARRE